MDADSASGTVVLVHGGFVDGSGWQGVYGHLKKNGYNVAVVQNPTLSLEGDVAATNMVTDAQGEPVILVGHSYGGAVITGAGTNPNVMALVYIAGFMPDAGESVNTLIAGFPTDGPQPPILPPRDGFLFLDREKFHASFAGDLDDDQAAFMADSQVPWGVEALGGTITEPAWRSKPSMYLVTTEDRMIPPSAQRDMSARAGSTVVEVSASHSVYVSQPAAVAELIEKAASEVRSAVQADSGPPATLGTGVHKTRRRPGSVVLQVSGLPGVGLQRSTPTPVPLAGSRPKPTRPRQFSSPLGTGEAASLGRAPDAPALEPAMLGEPSENTR